MDHLLQRFSMVFGSYIVSHMFFDAPKGTMGLVFVKFGNGPPHTNHPPNPPAPQVLPDQSQLKRPHCLHVGRFETTAASLCALTSMVGILTKGRQLPLRSSRSHLAFQFFCSCFFSLFLVPTRHDTTPLATRKLVRRARAGAPKFGQVELEINEEAGFKWGGLGANLMGSLRVRDFRTS